jgi:hypothetical protein
MAMTSRRPAGRATRQILSGADLAPSPHLVAGRDPARDTVSLTLGYFLILSALVVVAALVWALWGMAPASPIVLALALGLIASWLVL